MGNKLPFSIADEPADDTALRLEMEEARAVESESPDRRIDREIAGPAIGCLSGECVNRARRPAS